MIALCLLCLFHGDPSGRISSCGFREESGTLPANSAGWKPCVVPQPTTESEGFAPIAYSLDGNLLAAGKSTYLHVYDANLGKFIGGLDLSGGRITSAAFLPDGHTVLTGWYPGLVILWDSALENRAQIRLADPRKHPRSYHHEWRKLVFGQSQSRSRLQGKEGVSRVAAAPDGGWVCAVAFEKTAAGLQVWNTPPESSSAEYAIRGNLL